MRLATLFAAALVGFTATVETADAQRNRGATITLYEHVNYQGRSVVIDTDAPSLRYVNFNDITSSIRINGGQWEVCLDSEFRGTCHVVDNDLPNMSQWAFNDRISSVRPVHRENRRGRVRDQGITLWSGPNFTGRSVTLIDAEDNLRLQSFNDTAQSVEVHSGIWTVCRDSNFEGRCVELTRDVRNLSVYNLNREITSVIQGRRANHNPGYGGGRPGYGGGRARIDGAVRGVETVFFPQPEVRGYPVARCLGDNAGCGQATANEICEISGFRRAEFFSTRRTNETLWFLFERDARYGQAQITDVLCVR